MGIFILFVNEDKGLGVILYSKLLWEPHFIFIEKKINCVLHTLRFLRENTTKAMHTKLVQSLVMPHLDYCCTILLDAITKLKARLQRFCNSDILLG